MKSKVLIATVSVVLKKSSTGRLVAAAATECTNDADQAAWAAHKGAFESDMTTCGKQCLGAADCVATCIQKADGYSVSCSGCFGALAGCTKKHCALQCALGNSPSCKSCVDNNGCNTDFKTCSGVDVPTAATELQRLVYGWDM